MIILNEREYAEECLSNGKTIGKLFPTLSILAKYFYHQKEYRKKKIITALKEYVSTHYPPYQYNKSSFDELIEKTATRAGKYKLYEIDGVWITSKEIERISAISRPEIERLAFAFLCLAKLGNAKSEKNNYWVNDKAEEIFKTARVSGNDYDRFMKINELYDMGMIEMPMRNDKLSYRVTYADECGDKVLFVSDFRELGYEYLKYKGEPITKCFECGSLFRNNKQLNRKYCRKCAAYIPQKEKTVACIDCGKNFIINAKNNKTIRCEECQSKYRSIYQRNIMRKIRSSDEMLAQQIES